MPWTPDHGDPFDLLIIAQALPETLPVLTSDSKFQLVRRGRGEITVGGFC